MGDSNCLVTAVAAQSPSNALVFPALGSLRHSCVLHLQNSVSDLWECGVTGS